MYFLRRGCNWDAANNAGQTASVILVELGYSKEAMELLDSEAAKCRQLPSGLGGCMGLDGQCGNLAVLYVCLPSIKSLSTFAYAACPSPSLKRGANVGKMR